MTREEFFNICLTVADKIEMLCDADKREEFLTTVDVNKIYIPTLEDYE